MRPLELAGFVAGNLAGVGAPGCGAGLCRVNIRGALMWQYCCWLPCGLVAYWQLIPLYAGRDVDVVRADRMRRERPRWLRATLATVVTALLLMTAGFTYVLPMFALPKPTGPYAIGTRIEPLVDPVRMETHVAGSAKPREIMVQIWYPATPHHQRLASYRRRRETTLLSSYMAVLKTHSYKNAAVATNGAPFPVLLFNPAWGGERTQNTYQVEDLASHGFIVVGIDHTYNSRSGGISGWARDLEHGCARHFRFSTHDVAAANCHRG